MNQHVSTIIVMFPTWKCDDWCLLEFPREFITAFCSIRLLILKIWVKISRFFIEKYLICWPFIRMYICSSGNRSNSEIEYMKRKKDCPGIRLFFTIVICSFSGTIRHSSSLASWLTRVSGITWIEWNGHEMFWWWWKTQSSYFFSPFASHLSYFSHFWYNTFWLPSYFGYL